MQLVFGFVFLVFPLIKLFEDLVLANKSLFLLLSLVFKILQFIFIDTLLKFIPPKLRKQLIIFNLHRLNLLFVLPLQLGLLILILRQLPPHLPQIPLQLLYRLLILRQQLLLYLFVLLHLFDQFGVL